MIRAVSHRISSACCNRIVRIVSYRCKCFLSNALLKIFIELCSLREKEREIYSSRAIFVNDLLREMSFDFYELLGPRFRVIYRDLIIYNSDIFNNFLSSFPS